MPNATQLIETAIRSGKLEQELPKILKEKKPYDPELINLICDGIRRPQDFSEQVIQYLIDKVSTVSALSDLDKTGDSPLHVAAKMGEFRIARTLIQKGGWQVYFKYNKKNLLPKQCIKQPEDEKLLKILTAEYVNLRILAFERGEKASLAQARRVYEVSQLLEDKESSEATLFEAIRTKSSAVVEVLLENKKIDVNKPYKGEYPLALAIDQGSEAIVALLMQHGADFRQKDKHGDPILYKMRALRLDHFYKIFSALIMKSQHAKLTAKELKDLKEPDKNFPVNLNNLSLFDDLPTHFIQTKATWAKNYSPYTKADLDRLYEVIVDKDLEAKSPGYGNTVLQLAVQYADMIWIQWLIEKGVLINTVNKEDESPLLTALISSQNIQIVELLLKQGADPYQRSKQGVEFFKFEAKGEFGRQIKKYHSLKDFIQFHLENGTIPKTEELEFVKSLRRKNDFDIEVADEKGFTALHLAVRAGKGWLEVVRFLLENKANIEFINQNKETPLLSAILSSERDEEIIQLLLKHGANSNVMYSDLTAEELAIQKKCSQTIIELLRLQKYPPPMNPQAFVANEEIIAPSAPPPHSMYPEILPNEIKAFDSTARIFTLTEVPVSENKENISFALVDDVIDLFSENLTFKKELKALFHQLPKTKESESLTKQLIQAYNEKNVPVLISIFEKENSSIHQKIAR